MLRKNPNTLVLISTEDQLSFLNLIKNVDIRTAGYIEFSATCSRCKSDGNVMECPHMKGYHSSVFAENRSTKLKELYTVCNQTEVMRQELFSTGTGMTERRFNAKDIELFIRGDPLNFKPSVIDMKSTIIIGVDPGGGGPSDHVYVAVMPGVNSRPVLVGIGLFDVSQELDDKIKEATLEFLIAIKKKFPDADIWVACEGAPASCGNDVFVVTDKFDDSVQFLCTMNSSNKMLFPSGIYPHEDVKDSYISNLATMLRSKILTVHSDIVAICNRPLTYRGKSYGKGSEDVFLLSMLEDELINYEKRPGGKTTGKVRGRQDDLVMALAYALGAIFEYIAQNLGFKPKRSESSFKRKYEDAFYE